MKMPLFKMLIHFILANPPNILPDSLYTIDKVFSMLSQRLWNAYAVKPCSDPLKINLELLNYLLLSHPLIISFSSLVLIKTESCRKGTLEYIF